MTSRLHDFLRGVRVLDLSRHLPGPLATLLLADMGAEVLKVESPEGDELRRLGPLGPSGDSLYFETVNAGKRSMRIDLKSAHGKAALLDLAREVDVLVESFRPGVMQRLGVGPEVLRAANPGLVHVALSGYGQHGPDSRRAGHDANYLALNGTLHASGAAGSTAYIHPPIADCTGSMFAVASILGALLARVRDGAGCEIDLALADVTMPFQLFGLAELGATGRVPAAEAEMLNGGWACYRPYRTRDGRQIALGAVEPKFWSAFCRASGRPEWIARHGEPLPQAALIDEVAAHFARLSLEKCLATYAEADCCLTPVLDLKQAVESDRSTGRGLVRRHPEMPIYEAAFPVLVNGERPKPRKLLSVEMPSAPRA